MLTINGAGPTKRLSYAEGLSIVRGVGLRAALVSPVDIGSKGLSMATSARHVDIVEDRITSLDDGDRHGKVMTCIGKHRRLISCRIEFRSPSDRRS
jgi:hypothetical protein